MLSSSHEYSGRPREVLKNVFNGDIGAIASIDSDDKTLIISFDRSSVLE